MKKYILILFSGFFFLTFAFNSYSIDIVTCKCGYTGGGECTPCGEEPIEVKIDDSNKKDESIPDTVCPCGYDMDGECVPCEYENN